MDSLTIPSSEWCINPRAVIAIYNLSQAGHKIFIASYQPPPPTFTITMDGITVFIIFWCNLRRKRSMRSPFIGTYQENRGWQSWMCCRDFATNLSLKSKKEKKNWNDFWYIIIQLHIRRSMLVPIPSNLPHPHFSQPIAGTLILIMERKSIGICKSPSNEAMQRNEILLCAPSELFCIWYSLFAISWRKPFPFGLFLLQRSCYVNSVDFALGPEISCDRRNVAPSFFRCLQMAEKLSHSSDEAVGVHVWLFILEKSKKYNMRGHTTHISFAFITSLQFFISHVKEEICETPLRLPIDGGGWNELNLIEKRKQNIMQISHI